jgi:predicted AAA+ superfamily ATPase
MKYLRLISNRIQKSKKSCLILGPRQTGKSTLIKSFFPDLTINLAREQTFLEFSSQPDLIERLIEKESVKTVFIDEVQRIPSLLNTIQAILDEEKLKVKFFLTGSSARKLRKGQANLLPGRVLAFYLAPLSLAEVDYQYELEQVLSTGLLPGIFSEEEKEARESILSTYAATYLKEEIQAEALTKNIEGFSRFLFVAAAKNGEFLDYAKIGTQANITQKTATRFFEILEDTLIVHRLTPFAHSNIARMIRHPKFYFFDLGVLNALLGNFQVSADRMGMLFETFVFNQIRTIAEISGKAFRLSTYRTEAGAEVDLIVEYENQVWAIEIKATRNIGKNDLRGLKSFSESCKKKCQLWVFYQGTHPMTVEDIQIFPLDTGLKAFSKIAGIT